MAAASPKSAQSSPASFVTAEDSASVSVSVSVSPPNKSTAASSPSQDHPCPYRPARPLSRELKNHCQIFLEEQLHSSAIGLLNSILCSGASKRTPTKKPVSVPPPSHLALLNTLIIHPLHTTRADKPEHLEVSSQALDYLHNLVAIVGPVNADLRTAFQFHSIPRRRWGQNANGNDSDLSDGDASDGERLRGKLANESSVWSRGQDFWSTVGWAFNCSTLHPQRWRYWKIWLEYMLDVLERDWTERQRRDAEAQLANPAGGEIREWRQDAMILMYLDQQNGRQNGIKVVIKALLADGSDLSTSAFREVFDKEPRGPKKESKKRKREQVLDLENDQFGDYFDDDSFSSGVSEPPTPQKPKDPGRVGPFGAHSPGLIESVDCRLRLFRLISDVAFSMRKRSELERLYAEFSASLKTLPLQMYSLFVTQRPNCLLLETHVTITKELFHLLLPASYKDPAKVDREADAQGSLTTPILQHCYLPYASNTVAMDDNAKLSLLVENAIQLLWKCDMLEYDEDFASAAIKGIDAREAKAKKKRVGKMKGDSSDAVAQDMLARSGERIRILLDVLASCT